MRWSAVLVLLGASTLAIAQESPLRAELRTEGERVSDACSAFTFKSVPGCAYTLFTDHPLHIAAGSMPPQNGFGLGGAFVWSKNTRNWRMSWDFDATGAFSGAWRAGGYMKMVQDMWRTRWPLVPANPCPGEPCKQMTGHLTVIDVDTMTTADQQQRKDIGDPEPKGRHYAVDVYEFRPKDARDESNVQGSGVTMYK